MALRYRIGNGVVKQNCCRAGNISLDPCVAGLVTLSSSTETTQMSAEAPATAKTIAFNILNRWSGAVQFTAEIECADDAPVSIKLGLAVRWAYKSGAVLRDADLSGADLRDADLSGADLRDADLRGADLRDADLRGADLRGAVLRGAVLRGAVLRDADLSGADLRGAKDADYAIACTRILPEGDIIGWKKCRDSVIVKLRIPADAKRSHAFGRKCRAEFADVIEVIGADYGISKHDGSTKYIAGQRVTPDAFDPNWTQECSSGVHFFITRIEAENY